MSETQRLFRNTAAQSAPIVTTFVFSFILAPIMLNRLGLAQFGVWAVTGALAQYARLLDLGITNSLSRFIALHDAEGDRRGIEETLGIGLLAAAGVGLIMLAAAAVSRRRSSATSSVSSTPGEMRIVLLVGCGYHGAIPARRSARVGSDRAAQDGSAQRRLDRWQRRQLRLQPGRAADQHRADRPTPWRTWRRRSSGSGSRRSRMTWVWRRPYFRRPSVRRSREIVSFGVKSQLVTLGEPGQCPDRQADHRGDARARARRVPTRSPTGSCRECSRLGC